MHDELPHNRQDSTMGPKVWQPKGSNPDGRWVSAAAGRLDGVRDGLAASSGLASKAAGAPPGKGSASSGVEPSATPEQPPNDTFGGHRAQGVQPRGQPTTQTEELAALRLGRTAPAAFNLQRHAVMVCGRPVVVPTLTSSVYVDVGKQSSCHF